MVPSTSRGPGVALDWMVSGRLVGADEASAKGLVTSVHEDVDASALELAKELAATTSPVSASTIRRLLFHAAGPTTPEQIQAIDSCLIASIGQSVDAREGVASFFERRAPRFSGSVPQDLPDWLPWLTDGEEGSAHGGG